MRLKFFIVGIAAILLAATAQGQDLKPVKDKGTKLFGYQDKSKNWVIPPAYFSAKNFKDGLAEVTVKPEKTKFHGIIDETGREVIPPVCTSVSIVKKERLIYAEREAEPGSGWLWGVYDYEGNELWAPQFTTTPTFHDGIGIARSAETGLKGVINLEGEVLLPFENLAIEHYYGNFTTLTEDFVRKAYDSRLNLTSEYAYPGYVIPYDPVGDPVRAAAWHVGPIGYRLHRNNLRAVDLIPGKWNAKATCSILQIDWGNDRFVRLEPVVDMTEHPGSMIDPLSGKLYTVKAVLYEADGSLVGELASWGWIDGEYSEGVVYNAEGNETWMIMRDINCPAMPSFSTSLSRSRQINHEDVVSGLGLHSYELQNMYDPERYADRALKIITEENAGITYRFPPEAPSIRLSRTINEIHRTPLFRHRFRMGDIVNCKVRPSGDGVELELSDNFLCRYEDRFDDPSFSMSGEEVLYWGPSNEYTAILTARKAHSTYGATKDDMYGSNEFFDFAIELYDRHDRYLQTIAVVPNIDFCTDGWIVMEKAGIALRMNGPGAHDSGHGVRPGGQGARPESRPNDYGNRPGGKYDGPYKVKISGERIPPTLSALNAATDIKKK